MLIQMMLSDLRYAFRTLRHSPGFAVAVCLVLALGIGANTALFTVVHRVLIEPLPFVEPERLVEVRERPGSGGPNAIAWPNYLDWAEQQRSFENLAFAMVAPRLLPRADGTELEPVAYVSGNFFDTYKVRPAIGRIFSEDEAGALLNHGYWKDRFGGDPSVLGRSIRVGDLSATIVGVLPEFPWHREAKIYLPVRHAIGPFMLANRENHNSSSVTGRLKPGVSLEQARADLSAIAARLRAVHPIANRDIGIYAISLHEWVTGGSRRTLLALFGAVAILLLLACVNAANMTLARSIAKGREFTVRLALGASQSAIVRQIMAECLVLGIGGALAGLVLSRLLLPALATFAPASLASRLNELNWTIFGFAAVVCLIATTLFGVAPIWAVSRLELHAGLKDRGSTGRAGHRWLRGALVSSQVALALVLLSGAGLLLRSLTRLIGEDPGFRTNQVVALKVSLPEGGDDLARLAARFATLKERVRMIPGVSGAASITIAPFAGSNSNAQIVPEGFELRPGVSIPAADFRATSPDYFQTMGIPLLRGRVYEKSDGVIPPIELRNVLQWFATARYQVVINEAMAKRFWPSRDPIGRTFRFGPPSMKGALMTVCGVVGDTRMRGLHEAPKPMFYLSSWLYPWPDQTILVRTAADPGALTRIVRREVLGAEPGAVVSDAKSLDSMIDELTASRRSNLAMMAGFAGVALLLAAIGVYGIMAYLTQLRQREFAVRMALGATSRIVLGTVVGDGAKLIASGLALGLLGATWLSRLIAGMLYGVTPSDPWSYAAAAALLSAAGIAALLGPAFRAASTDPSGSLRSE